MLKRNFPVEIRDEDSGLSGYAFKFSEKIAYLGQNERFSPDLTMELNENSYLLRDHNPERILGKSGQNVSFSLDDTGLVFKAKVLDTPLWKETKVLVKKGVLSGASIGFSSVKERMDGDTLTYERIKLFEVSILPFPAYQSSEVSARSKEKGLLPPELIL